MATRLDAINTAWLFAEGKSSSSLPAVGSRKRDILTDFAVKYNRDWQVEPRMEWQSLYADVNTTSVVTAGQKVYTLATPINFISQAEGNYIRIQTTDGQTISFMTVRPQQLQQYRTTNAVAQTGSNEITFSRNFVAGEQAIGGTIFVPAITKLPDLDNDSDEILIDNPEWLGVRMAAQYAYSFPSKREMYDDLLAQANELMLGMKSNNEPISSSYNTGIDYFATFGNVGIDE